MKVKNISLLNSQISISGNEKALIENYRGIIDYSCNCIKLSVKNGYIEILGIDLSIERMDKELIVITGELHSLCFIED